MKRILVILLAAVSVSLYAQLPANYKWVGNNTIAFTHDGSFNDAFTVSVKGKKWTNSKY